MTKHYREAVLAVLRSDMQKGDVLVVHNKWAVSSLSMRAPHHATHTSPVAPSDALWRCNTRFGHWPR